jgi:isopropylmalate/homocitrate/citramalate synthase
LGEVRSRWPDMPVALHLHDTRGLAVANAHARLKMGVSSSIRLWAGSVAARSPVSRKPPATSAPRNWSCSAEMGIDTGVDLDALIEVGRMAEDIVGHQLPGELIHAGSLDAFRRRAA